MGLVQINTAVNAEKETGAWDGLRLVTDTSRSTPQRAIPNKPLAVLTS